MEPRNRYQGMNSASLCSLAGRYNNHIPPRFLAPHRLFKNSSSVSQFVFILFIKVSLPLGGESGAGGRGSSLSLAVEGEEGAVGPITRAQSVAVLNHATFPRNSRIQVSSINFIIFVIFLTERGSGSIFSECTSVSRPYQLRKIKTRQNLFTI
jgi:hypothetical protein